MLITARDSAAATGAAAELGDGVTALPALDLTDPVSVRAGADAVAADPGRLDVLINNAAAYVDWAETGTGADLDAAHIRCGDQPVRGLAAGPRPCCRCCGAARPRASSTCPAAPAPTAIRLSA